MRPLLLLLAGCGWNHLPDGQYEFTDARWDPEGLIAADDGLYGELGKDRLVHIAADGTWAPVDPGGNVRSLLADPSGNGVLAFIDEISCDNEDVSAGQIIGECPADDRVRTSFVARMSDGVVEARFPVANHYNRLAFAPTDAFAVAYLEPDATTEIRGVVNLTEVEILSLSDGERVPVRVGFAADRVLFTDDGTRAVVLSDSSVAVVDLVSSPPAVTTTFPLTLDPDQLVDPVGVDLTPDGNFALISVQGSADLYVLDLVDPSVNIVSLSAAPTDMFVSEVLDATLLVYGSALALDIIDHARFERRTLTLEEPMDQIAGNDEMALLSSTRGNKDLYRFRFSDQRLFEYRTQNPPLDVTLADSGEFAVVLTSQESGTGFYDGRPGMEVLDLRDDQDDAIPYALDGVGLGTAFVGTEAFVLQDGVDYLWRSDVSTGLADTIDLIAAPRAIGRLGDQLYVTHDVSMGLVTLFDPETNTQTSVEGFALTGILDGPVLQEAP